MDRAPFFVHSGVSLGWGLRVGPHGEYHEPLSRRVVGASRVGRVHVSQRGSGAARRLGAVLATVLAACCAAPTATAAPPDVTAWPLILVQDHADGSARIDGAVVDYVVCAREVGRPHTECTRASDRLDRATRTISGSSDLLARTATLPSDTRGVVTVEVTLVEVPVGWHPPRRPITAVQAGHGWAMNDDTPHDHAITFRLTGSAPVTPTPTPTPPPVTPTGTPSPGPGPSPSPSASAGPRPSPAPSPTARRRPTPTVAPRLRSLPPPFPRAPEAPTTVGSATPAPLEPTAGPAPAPPTPATDPVPNTTGVATPPPTVATPAPPSTRGVPWWESALASPATPIIGGGIIFTVLLLLLAPPFLRPPTP